MSSRKEQAIHVRRQAAKLAHKRPAAKHMSNGEEMLYRPYGSFMTFTKGLAHDEESGLVKDNYQPEQYRSAIDAGLVSNFNDIPIGSLDADGKRHWTFHKGALEDKEQGDQHRRWESPTAGFVFELEGPDPQSVTMPPAPALQECVDGEMVAGKELLAEMAEVYLLALLRDVPFENFDTAAGGKMQVKVKKAITLLKKLEFYKEGGSAQRPRPLAADLNQNNVFRGHTPGDRVGPYLSQFLHIGDQHLGAPPVQSSTEGYLRYGAINIDLRVRVATAKKDFMTNWHEWLDVQNGANVGSTQDKYYVDSKIRNEAFRFATTPRDMATYVHFDALYEAYLNACLWLLNVGAPFDPRFSSALGNTRSTQGFALFGGPHILTLVTEVATRALKAVRYQKFNNHLRARPEVLAARLAAYEYTETLPPMVEKVIKPFHKELQDIGLLELVRQHNKKQNESHKDYLAKCPKGTISADSALPLLPMAFAEGSPMHPTYGAGHATVAGACVTILKAFFDEDAMLVKKGEKHFATRLNCDPAVKPFAYVPSHDGKDLCATKDETALTVGNELNKLAANISIARNMAGVHFYSDYIESLRMGEQIAIGILEEQAVTYQQGDKFRLGFTTFDGEDCVIGD